MKAQAKNGWLQSKLGMDSITLWGGGMDGSLEVPHVTSGNILRAAMEIISQDLADVYVTDAEGNDVDGFPPDVIIVGKE